MFLQPTLQLFPSADIALEMLYLHPTIKKEGYESKTERISQPFGISSWWDDGRHQRLLNRH